jgi:benzoate 4-monooxygenase
MLPTRFTAHLQYSVIGDLAFGRPFGMIEREADIAEVEDDDGNVLLLPAVKILNERGEYSATQGALMPWLRPYMRVRF